MLDNPEKTARLLAALKAAVPFKVELVPSLVVIHSSSPDPQHRFIVAKCYGPQRLHCLPGHVGLEVRRETGKE
jgi:hypothetical protein